VNTRRFLAVPVLALGALVAQTGLAAPAAHAVGPRYASPTGTGAQTCLSQAAACSIDKAINSAAANDEVIILSGTYDVGTTALKNLLAGVNVHGVAGQPRPVINTAADIGLEIKGDGAKVADLTINHTGAIFGLNVFANNVSVQRVEVHSGAPVTCGLGYAGLVRDSVCVNTAPGGFALDDTWHGGVGALTVRNLTAVATGASSYGINAVSDGASTDLDINGKNVIASGTAADVRSNEVGTDSESDVNLTNSNYDKITELGGGNVTNIGSVTNQTALPVFSDTVTYHQALGSPTIDKGTSDASVGTTDIDGDPRKVGTAVDIGADELVPDTTPPNVTLDHGPKAKSHKRKAVFVFHASEPVVFTCVVDHRPTVVCSSPFKVKLKKRGKHQLVIGANDLANNYDATPVVYTWKIKKKGHGHKPHHHHRHH
jgi:hypothetical protein